MHLTLGSGNGIFDLNSPDLNGDKNEADDDDKSIVDSQEIDEIDEKAIPVNHPGNGHIINAL